MNCILYCIYYACTCRYIVDIFIAEHLCARHLIAEYWGLDIHVCMFVLMSVMLRNAISCTLVVTLECISLMYTLYYIIICVRTFISGLPLPCTSWPCLLSMLFVNGRPYYGSREYTTLRRRRERDCGHDRERKHKLVRICKQQSRAPETDEQRSHSDYVGKGRSTKSISKQHQPIISKKRARHYFALCVLLVHVHIYEVGHRTNVFRVNTFTCMHSFLTIPLTRNSL